jgi:hypothetical protein
VPVHKDIFFNDPFTPTESIDGAYENQNNDNDNHFSCGVHVPILETKKEFQGLHETVEHAMMGLYVTHRNDNRRKEGHRILKVREAIMGIMIIEHLIVERIEILLYVLQLLKDTLIPNGIPGILILGYKNKTPLLLIIPNGDPEVPSALPLIPQMDSGFQPERLIVQL